jgi:hypothetical protein
MAQEAEVETLRDSGGDSISFAIITESGARYCGAILERLRAARRESDEVLLVTRDDRVRDLPVPIEPWFRVVAVPGDASEFTLRGHLPLIARKDWVVALEDHVLVTADTFSAIRDMIRTRADIDLVVFLAANLTSVTRWSWAAFLHTFTLVWAPIAGPPPYAPVTSAIIRRSVLGAEKLKDGEWEFEIIPRLLREERYAYANDIYVDHVKPIRALAAFALIYHNGRACAGIERRMGRSARKIVGTAASRTRLIGPTLIARKAQLPSGTVWRWRVLQVAHVLGAAVGVALGGGRSAHKLGM